MPNYAKVSEAKGPLVVIENVKNPAYGEIVEIETEEGKKLGMILDAQEKIAIAQLFEETSLEVGAKVKQRGETLKLGVSEDFIGGIFDGFGNAIKGPQPFPEEKLDVNGYPINPAARKFPSEPIFTGISAIDVPHILLKGQKIAVFSGSGLPAEKLATQIARQAKTKKETDFYVVFAAIGVPSEIYQFFMKEFEKTGALARSAVFISKADSSPIEKIMTPRVALTLAEYLAFEKEYDVLAILIDMTNYADALREISAARKEIPGRRGYPGYLYTDLATLYERTGVVKGKKGSITQIPILTMPADDITHPVPDLTGYITEGQYVLSRDLYKKGIYPPIDLLKSLSRLGRNGMGKGKTREDHKEVADQLIAAYAKGLDVRDMATIVGEDALTETDKAYLRFADAVESRFIKQDYYEERSIEESLDLAWELFTILPEEELTKIKPETLKKYHPKYRKA